MMTRVALTASLAMVVTAALAGEAGGGDALDPLAAHAAAMQSAPSPPPACTGLDRVMGVIEAVGGHNFQFLDGTAARSAAAIYNETPPVSQQDWSLVALVDGPDGTGSVLVGNGAEVCGRVNFGPELWPRLVERLLGQRA